VSLTDQGEPSVFPGRVKESQAGLSCFLKVGGRGSNFPRGTRPQGVREGVVDIEVSYYQEGDIQGWKQGIGGDGVDSVVMCVD